MSMIDGFEVVEKPDGIRCIKYKELFDAAAECGDGQCTAKDYGSAEEAESESCRIRHVLYYWQKRNDRWKDLKVRKSGSKVFVLKA